jgi:hypothetical protein
MSILQIRKAVREGSRMIIGIAGQSGDGKTYTALQLAYGLAKGDASKIGFLDTENKRGSLYADVLKSKDGTVQQFLIGDLYAPFSPNRYKQAILEFQAAGVEVLVIDSVSHEYEGEGGYLEIRQPLPGKFANNDNVASEKHKEFMRALLQSNMHVICCVRAREKTKIEKGVNPETGKNGTYYVPLGIQPIQHRDFMFEMTASLMMRDQGKRQDVLKCPEELMGILGRGEGYISPKDGLALRKWIDGGAKLDPAVEHARNTLQTLTENGVAAIERAWLETSLAVRKALGEQFLAQIKASASAFDAKRVEQQDVSAADVDALNAAAAEVNETPPAVEAATEPKAAPTETPTTTEDDDGVF